MITDNERLMRYCEEDAQLSYRLEMARRQMETDDNVRLRTTLWSLTTLMSIIVVITLMEVLS